jgi:ABC-2 type transport system permease protein
MNRLLIKKCVNESLLLHSACASMLFVFCCMRVWIVCQFDLQQFEPLLEQFRRFEKFSPVPLEQLLTYAGTIGMTFSEPVLILCVLIWCIARGSDVVSGELGRGTLEMLLSRPIGRVRLLVIHSSVCVAGLALLCFVAWFGIYVGIHSNTIRETQATASISIPFLSMNWPIEIGTPVELDIPLASRVAPTLFLPTIVNLFSFGFFVLGLSTLLSSVDRFRWRTIGLTISIYIVQLLIFLLSKVNEAWRFLENFTFFASYQPDAIVNFVQKHPEATWAIMTPASAQSALWPHALGPLGLSLFLIALGSLFLTLATVVFHKRDLPAPL